MFKTLPLPLMAAIVVMISGCSLIYKPTGWVLTSYSQDHAVPYAMASGDIDLTACGSGKGLNQLLGSFGPVIGRPSKLMVAVGLLAGICSEAKAYEADLHFARALHTGNIAEARDARTKAQRLYRTTALRRYQVYKDTVDAFGELGEGQCPSFGNDTLEAEYMAGVLTSVQGLLSDIQASSSVGVPQNIARKAGRAITCLDNDKWWGVPNAVQAVVWLTVPGTTPEGTDPWAQLKQATNLGEQQGMPLAATFYALAGYGQSDVAKEKEGIRQVAHIYNNVEPPADYLLFVELAYQQAQFLSDRLWTKQTGKRTPFEGMGTFPGESSSDSGAEVNAEDYL